MHETSDIDLHITIRRNGKAHRRWRGQCVGEFEDIMPFSSSITDVAGEDSDPLTTVGRGDSEGIIGGGLADSFICHINPTG